MKFLSPQNPNYSAVVTKIKDIVPLTADEKTGKKDCENIVGVPMFGVQVLTGKDAMIGDVGVFFPAETQLSEEYCRQNDLFAHPEKNLHPDKKGYVGDKGRVVAVKFRGHSSTGLFMPRSSLAYTGIDWYDLKEGDTFDVIGDHKICKKYERVIYIPRGNRQSAPRVFNRVDTKYFPEHLDSENYFRNDRTIDPEQEIIVTQKIHGTSGRWGHSVVKRKLNLFEWLLKRLGVKVSETEYDTLAGSRRVVKDIKNPYRSFKHYYDTDLWNLYGDNRLADLIPKGYVIYGEIVGWTPNGAAIQSDFTYDELHGQCEMYCYRVAHINEDGLSVDLPWDQMRAFCEERGIETVKEIWRGKHKDFVAMDFVNKRLKETYPQCIALSHPSLPDEGVCIRVDRMTPYILKAKGEAFLRHESSMLDKEVVDIEAAESVVEEHPLP